jgi:hypothetical protein
MLELRPDRMSTVREVIEGLTGASLDSHTEPVEGPGWPQPRSYPVRECQLCTLNEEWEHRLYAEREPECPGGAELNATELEQHYRRSMLRRAVTRAAAVLARIGRPSRS